MSNEQTPLEKPMPGIEELTAGQPQSTELAQVIPFPTDRIVGANDSALKQDSTARNERGLHGIENDGERMRQQELRASFGDPDAQATVESERTWEAVNSLERPAGTPQQQQLGHDVLRIVGQ